MNKQHFLSRSPFVFEEIYSGALTCDVEFNDHYFLLGETLSYREINDDGHRTGREVGPFRIARVFTEPIIKGLRPGYALIQFEKY